MNIAVYIRVSSHSQKSASQRTDIRRWLTAYGHDLDTVQWFEDQETGATLQRPGLLALKEAIFAGTVKTVVVWKLDRLARSMREGINTLTAWCESGVRVVSVTQHIDLSGTVGHLALASCSPLPKSSCNTRGSVRPQGSRPPRRTACTGDVQRAPQRPSPAGPKS
jgi:DNA invertase Pin-like site-specific DNA recombinase